MRPYDREHFRLHSRVAHISSQLHRSESQTARAVPTHCWATGPRTRRRAAAIPKPNPRARPRESPAHTGAPNTAADGSRARDSLTATSLRGWLEQTHGVGAGGSGGERAAGAALGTGTAVRWRVCSNCSRACQSGRIPTIHSADQQAPIDAQRRAAKDKPMCLAHVAANQPLKPRKSPMPTAKCKQQQMHNHNCDVVGTLCWYLRSC